MFFRIGGEFVDGWQYAEGEIIGKTEKPDMESPPPGVARQPGMSGLRSLLKLITYQQGPVSVV